MVCTVAPCLMMAVGVTGRVSRDAPGAYRKGGDMIYFTLIKILLLAAIKTETGYICIVISGCNYTSLLHHLTEKEDVCMPPFC